MGIKLMALGGYNEVGRNMTAIDVDGEIVIFDIGLYIPAVIEYEEVQETLTNDQMRRIKAIPDDRVLRKRRDDVKAILIGHAHLDHLGGIPYVANTYSGAPIIGTPFTIKVLEKILKDKNRKVRNERIVLDAGEKIKVSENLEVEFINATHSTVNCVFMVVHTKHGQVVYSLDFKLDNNPVIGRKPNYEKLKSLGNVRALILDSLYAREDVKTPSEKVAREMLKDVLLGTDNHGRAIVVTTFSSHIARLKTIIEMGQKLGRKIVFLGRSLNRYVGAAEEAGIVKFSDKVEIVGYANKIRKKLTQINKQGTHKYLIVCTGNQAEPGSVLTKMANGKFHFDFNYEDHIIFSCRVIPVEDNINQREKLENKLKSLGCRIFTDIHVSGHSGREDDRDLINLLNPKKIIPAHGGRSITKPGEELAEAMGYKLGKDVFILKDGDVIDL
ncbi:MAG: RNase J family beta-CASP ribonuclease [Candidatus Woesearchaeota archaeon]